MSTITPYSPLAPDGFQHPSTLAAVYTPLTGTTVALLGGQETAIISPAGTIAALTVTFNTIPHGRIVKLLFTQIVTALTISVPTGYTLTGAALTAATVGTAPSWVLVGSVFYRLT
jgi:hypothetical protein